MYNEVTHRYNDYGTYIRKRFGERIQKISINAGFNCPNRDGTKGTGGCTYCNNDSFSPAYTNPLISVTQQLREGISFLSKKYDAKKYIAYFQSYTNTYSDVEILRNVYWQALQYPGVVGIIVGTRPDCINKEIIDLLSEIAKKFYVSLEIGIESTVNRTLQLINRCHTYEDTIQAFRLAQNKGIDLGGHIILNLPGEDEKEMLNHAVQISKLPVNTLKLHHLQIVKHTLMSSQYKNNPDSFNLLSVDEYTDLVCKFISLLREDIIIERFMSETPKRLLIAPKWNGIRQDELIRQINKKLNKKKIVQGCLLK